MIGLALSVFFGLILLALGWKWQEAYRNSTCLLFWWNMVITLFLTGIWFSGTVFIAGLGGLLSGTVGFLVGLTGGGLTLSVLMGFMVTMSCLQTFGVLLFYNAVAVEENGNYRWNLAMLLVGVIFFIVGLSRIFG